MDNQEDQDQTQKSLPRLTPELEAMLAENNRLPQEVPTPSLFPPPPPENQLPPPTLLDLANQHNQKQEEGRKLVQEVVKRNTAARPSSDAKQNKESKDELPPTLKPTAKEREWDNYFRYRFGPFIILVLWIVLSDLDRATWYAPNPTECRDFAPHGARIAAAVEDYFKVPKWAHKLFMTSDDMVSMGMVIVGYLDRIGVLGKVQATVGLKEAKDRRNEQGNGVDKGVPPANGAVGGDIPDISGVFGIGSQYIPV